MRDKTPTLNIRLLDFLVGIHYHQPNSLLMNGHCPDPLKHRSFEIVVVFLFVFGNEESLLLEYGDLVK